MNITTKKTTTTVYESTISGDELRALALVAMKNSIDPDATANITVSEADQNADGSITVKVAVETCAENSSTSAADEAKPAAPVVGTLMPEAPALGATIPLTVGTFAAA